MRAALILTGGKSKRFGKNKAFVKIGDEYLLDKIIVTSSLYAERIFLSVHSEEQITEIKAKLNTSTNNIMFIMDNGEGPIKAIHNSMEIINKTTNTRYLLVCPVDMPLIGIDDIRRMQDTIEIDDGDLVTYAADKSWLTTLFFICDLPKILSHQFTRLNRADDLIRQLSKILILHYEDIAYSQFININTPELLDKLVRNSDNYNTITQFHPECISPFFIEYPNCKNVEKELRRWDVLQVKAHILMDASKSLGDEFVSCEKYHHYKEVIHQFNQMKNKK